MESKQFSIQLLKWYEKNKRDLPWRSTRNPYAIWLSEIILQQTRVAQGLEYYIKFLSAFPDIFAFAAAPEDKIMMLWQGLGYYSRARYMMEAAKKIVKNYKGEFPSTYNELLTLKGIGTYTAAAIASISFNVPVAVIDGNVLRVFSRYAGIMESIEKPAVRQIIRSALEFLIDKKKPAEFNQAMMELGAICCTPRDPDCPNCPLALSCYAANHNLQSKIPVKKIKTRPKLRYFHYLILHSEDTFYLKKRSGKDIWKALYEFPLIETESSVTPALFLKTQNLKHLAGTSKIEILKISDQITHQLSHQTIHAYFYTIKAKGKYLHLDGDFIPVSRESLPKYAFPRLIARYLEDNDYMD
jgi:A/G-specific adenine glycosylase